MEFCFWSKSRSNVGHDLLFVLKLLVLKLISDPNHVNTNSYFFSNWYPILTNDVRFFGFEWKLSMSKQCARNLGNSMTASVWKNRLSLRLFLIVSKLNFDWKQIQTVRNFVFDWDNVRNAYKRFVIHNVAKNRPIHTTNSIPSRHWTKRHIRLLNSAFLTCATSTRQHTASFNDFTCPNRSMKTKIYNFFEFLTCESMGFFQMLRWKFC